MTFVLRCIDSVTVSWNPLSWWTGQLVLCPGLSEGGLQFIMSLLWYGDINNQHGGVTNQGHSIQTSITNPVCR